MYKWRGDIGQGGLKPAGLQQKRFHSEGSFGSDHVKMSRRFQEDMVRCIFLGREMNAGEDLEARERACLGTMCS